MKKSVSVNRFKDDWVKHNKWLKRNHMQKISLAEYIDYCHGKVVSPKREFKEYKPSHKYLRDTQKIASLDAGGFGGVKIDDSYKQEVSRQDVVGQAYNKGGYQVLSKSEANDPATGKRR